MILVTGATGKVGQEVVLQLSAGSVPVRALVRDPVRASSIRLPGVDIAIGDLAKPDTLDLALSGVDRVFLLSAPDPDQVTLQGNMVQASKRAGVGHIVKVSVAGGPDAGTQLGRWHWTTEKQIEASGIGFTMLRPTLYMQQTLTYAREIAASGSFSAPAGAAEVALVDTRDVAAVAVRALTEPGHEQKIYDLTGPEALSFETMAEEIGQAIGRKIAYVHAPPEWARKHMLASGVPRWLADDMLILFASIREGYVAAVSDTVQRITGQPARTFRQFARDYADAFREGRAPGSSGPIV